MGKLKRTLYFVQSMLLAVSALLRHGEIEAVTALIDRTLEIVTNALPQDELGDREELEEEDIHGP